MAKLRVRPFRCEGGAARDKLVLGQQSVIPASCRAFFGDSGGSCTGYRIWKVDSFVYQSDVY